MLGKSTTSRWLVFPLLLIGSVAFVFPFLWMGSTSVKAERELFRGQLALLPEQPNVPVKSPYYDARQFAGIELPEPQASAVLPALRERVNAVDATLPASPLDEEIRASIATGLFRQIRNRAPAAIWNGSAEALQSFAVAAASAARIAEVAGEAYRDLCIGSIRARSRDLQDVELAPESAPSKRWNNLFPDAAALIDKDDIGNRFMAVRYDFQKSDRFVLEQTFDLPFPASGLDRLQLRLKPDDSWHQLNISIEAAGVKYIGRRATSLQDFRWATVTWQKQSADDESTKLRTWVVLQRAGEGIEFNHGEKAIRVRLEVVRRTQLQADFAKGQFNYQRVLDQIPFWRYVRVSVLLVILNIVLTLLSSSLVAYAFARLQWPGRDIAFLIMLGTMMIPGQVVMIPHFLIWKSVGGYNTLVPLFAGAVFGNAFFIFLMRQFLKGIPVDLEDAARIDGCGTLRIWWHVMLPLIKPSLAAIAIFTFMNTWNDFMGPLIYLADQRLYPLAFGLYAFSVQVNSNPVLTMAGSMLMTIPVIVVFALAQRHFVQGITLTGMKG